MGYCGSRREMVTGIGSIGDLQGEKPLLGTRPGLEHSASMCACTHV